MEDFITRLMNSAIFLTLIVGGFVTAAGMAEVEGLAWGIPGVLFSFGCAAFVLSHRSQFLWGDR